MKKLPLSMVVFATGFYTTFVLQNLWNWFVVPALHTAEVSYWMMYGIQLIWDLLSVRGWDNPVNERRWEVALMAIDMCIPDEKRVRFGESLNAIEGARWSKLAEQVAGDLAAATVTLAVAWGIHTFLAVR